MAAIEKQILPHHPVGKLSKFSSHVKSDSCYTMLCVTLWLRYRADTLSSFDVLILKKAKWVQCWASAITLTPRLKLSGKSNEKANESKEKLSLML